MNEAICPMCGEECDSVKRRRQNTRYANDEQNYVTTCKTCFEEIQEHWADMWSDYYSNIL